MESLLMLKHLKKLIQGFLNMMRKLTTTQLS
jgi:hypothetical protein